jgi:hypothetical protein
MDIISKQSTRRDRRKEQITKDIFDPDRSSIQKERLSRHPQVVFIYSIDYYHKKN